MKLESLRIINCFGFRDSNEVNLNNANNFIYILGRNSSGKSSLLNAINYFEVDITPNQKPNFTNYNKLTKTPALIAKFTFEDSDLDFTDFTRRLNSTLNEKTLDNYAIKNSNKIKTLYDTVLTTYEELTNELLIEKKVEIQKLGDGSYHIIQNDFDKYKNRKSVIESAIKNTRESDGYIVVSGQRRQIEITFRTFEDILFYQFPKIYIFNQEHPLNESLSQTITRKWETNSNQFEKRFIEYLDKDKINGYLNTEDPEEREPILEELRHQLKELIDKVNENHASVEKTDLLEMRLDPFLEGLQLTVKTDGKKSYYTHLSDNTKFLFAYHLYAQTDNINNNILLFDEPNNGFHPTAQKKMLRFLQNLGRKGNLVIVSTHSEYLIDPDYLSSIRIMSSDENKNTIVKNHFYNQTNKKGDFYALQPVFDAIGFKYGNQLEIENKVVVMEGVTDLLYLRAFNKILGFDLPLHIAPARGEGTIPHVISFLISQGLSFKIVIDKGTITEHLKTDFSIDGKFIHEVPIPASFVGRMNGSGIEDLFSKNDFEKLLESIGHSPTASFPNVSNSHYMKSNDVNNTDKRLVAHNFHEKMDTFKKKDFEKDTVDNFKNVLEFCKNSDWFSL